MGNFDLEALVTIGDRRAGYVGEVGRVVKTCAIGGAAVDGDDNRRECPHRCWPAPGRRQSAVQRRY